MSEPRQSAVSEQVMPSELRWLLSKKDRTEPNYDLLLKCLATMDSNMVRMQELLTALRDTYADAQQAAPGFSKPYVEKILGR